MQGVLVTEGEAGLTIERRLPLRWQKVAVVATFVAGAALLGAEPGLGWSGAGALVLVFALTAGAMPDRIRARARAGVVRRLRRRLVIAPERAGDGYREGGRATTITVDGHERPGSDLRRVVVGRELMAVVDRDGSVTEQPRGGWVGLIFDDEVVLVEHAATVDEASALAERLAGAAGLEVGWLADTRVGVESMNYSNSIVESRVAWVSFVELARLPSPEVGHLAWWRSALLATVGALGLIVAITTMLVCELSDRADDPTGRWLTAGLAFGAWVLIDAAVMSAGTAIIRGSVRAAARERYGLPAAPPPGASVTGRT